MKAAGSTLTLGELREATKDLPDTAQVRADGWPLGGVRQAGDEVLLDPLGELRYACFGCPVGEL